MNTAVFLDRDKTLVERCDNPGDPSQVRLVRGAASAVASLRGLGYKIVVVTNQDGVAAGRYSEEDVAAVHEQINQQIKQTTGVTIDRFYFCPYDRAAAVDRYRKDHPWHKPNPGMILQAAKDLQVDLEHSWTIGEQSSDIEAGIAAGTHTILLSDEVDDLHPVDREGAVDAEYLAPNLIEAVKVVAQQRHPEAQEVMRRRAGSNPPHARAEVRTAASPDDARVEEERSEPVRSHGRVDAPRRPPAPQRSAEPSATDDETVSFKLGQILQELRGQRGAGRDIGVITVAAMVLQAATVLCLGGALLMGSAAGGAMFFRWIACGLLIQLAVIALLLFDQR